MNRQQKIMLSVRLIGAGVILRFVYDETGPWTVALLVLMTLGLEAQAALWRRLTDTLNGKKIWQ